MTEVRNPYQLARFYVRLRFPSLLRQLPQDTEQTIQLALLKAERIGGSIQTNICREMRDLARSAGWLVTGRGWQRGDRVAAECLHMLRRRRRGMKYPASASDAERYRLAGERGGEAYRKAALERALPKWRLARDLRMHGQSLKQIATALGYASESGVAEALSRLAKYEGGKRE